MMARKVQELKASNHDSEDEITVSERGKVRCGRGT